jgi:acyl carrier protein
METGAKLKEILRQIAHKPIDPADGDSLFESGLLDSFSLLDLVREIETQFGISIPDRDLQPRRFDSMARIEAYINTRK